MNPIPYARQSIVEEDIAEVVRVLTSPFLTQGPEITRFETTVAEATGARFGTAVCNATSALHIACKALGVGPGARVWTSPNSFVASANCALYCGAEVDFVDIDPRTYNIDPVAFEQKLAVAEHEGRLPKAVVVVHFAGTPCDLQPIAESARRRGVAVIEDASHAIGARYRGTRIGDSTFSDVTVFSFHPVKIVTTGEGGMVMTNREELHERLQLLRSHGITREPAEMIHASGGGWYYEQIELGYNYRMTDLQAALGTLQMRRLPLFLARRQELARRYEVGFAGSPVRLPICDSDRTSAWHLYVVQVDAARRREIFDRLRDRGILVNVHYIPIHLQPYYRALGFAEGEFPRAEAYYAAALSLPMYFELTDEDQDRVIAEVRAAVGEPALQK